MNATITAVAQPLFKRCIFVGILLALPFVSSAQTDYEHGHQAMQLFDSEGFEKAPSWVQYWIYFMMASFASSLFFVKNHVEARWVAGGFLVGAALMMIAGRVFGLPMLSGLIALMHIVGWTPALVVLLKRRPFLQGVSAFSIWSGVMTFVILFSFVFDIRDAAIFLANYP